MDESVAKNELYVLGELKSQDKKAVAVVGSRKFSKRGEELTKLFVSVLVENGITIVSGLARGIDTIAHKQALDSGGRTIAVLGSGIDVVYPPENTDLANRIPKNGALVSGFVNGTKPLPENFLARNGLIVKLSQAVLVVEGLRRSGTISTANHAGMQGVEVFAVPGSEACDYLIENGATIANSPQTIIDYLDAINI